MRTLVPVILFVFSFSQATAQLRFAFEQEINTKIYHGNDTVINPWAGGLNYPIFNNFDFNFDGLDDILVFDRSGKRLLPMVNEIINGDTVLRYHPEYIDDFPIPRGEGAMVLLRDYNCDGKDDLFYSDGLFIKVFENTSSNGQISFIPANNGQALNTDYGASGVSRLYIPRTDLPDINDVDGDGDLDILTFGNGGVRVEFHENQTPCGLDFVQAGTCWGLFEEGGLYRTVMLNKCTGGNKRDLGKVMHAGSAMLTWDMDNDSDVDLLLTNVSYNNLSLLINGGTLDSSAMISQDTMYPGNTPVDLFVFPAPYRVETGTDGIDDMVVSSFSSASSGSPDMSSNHRGIWRYRNIGSNNQPNFVFEEDDFLQGDMVDPGAASIPRLVDINGDSLVDLILSIANRYQQPGISSSQFYYYENTGSANQAEFSLVDTNFADILQYSLGTELVPAFGDLDGDGDQDMIVGAISGYFHYFENIGSANNPNFNLNTPIITNTDVGADAAPYLFDLDNDGDLDLFVGNEQGKVWWFENSSASSPNFSQKSDFFGAVDVSQLGLSANAVPVFYRDTTGTSTLFVGSRDQGVVQYDDIDTIATLPASVSDTLGNASDQSNNSDQSLFGISKRSGRNQFLILASELQAKGYRYGYIESLGFNIVDKGGSVLSNGFTIKIKNTNLSTLNNFEDNFPSPYPVEDFIYGFGNGWNNVPLQYPHLWDGQSNLIIEVCFSGNFPANNIHLAMTDQGFNCHALGDITGFNNLSADGCAMPYLQTISKRPDVRINLTPAANPVPNVGVNDLYIGERTTADFADIDGDGYLDAVVGNLSGGLSLFKGVLYDVSRPEYRTKNNSVYIYPNPNNGRFTIDLNTSDLMDFEHIRIFNIQGQLIWEQPVTEEAQVEIPNKPSPGIYLGQLVGPSGQKSFRFIMQP
jgi:hypothetical protein